mmetsp:Transcript_6392/g.13081  ORF Transcript_6392/g.13081 Transcript_6392/m.13081 type:complete len:226 (+) Transcript_6392:323-1000(+)
MAGLVPSSLWLLLLLLLLRVWKRRCRSRSKGIRFKKRRGRIRSHRLCFSKIAVVSRKHLRGWRWYGRRGFLLVLRLLWWGFSKGGPKIGKGGNFGVGLSKYGGSHQFTVLTHLHGNLACVLSRFLDAFGPSRLGSSVISVAQKGHLLPSPCIVGCRAHVIVIHIVCRPPSHGGRPRFFEYGTHCDGTYVCVCVCVCVCARHGYEGMSSNSQTNEVNFLHPKRILN